VGELDQHHPDDVGVVAALFLYRVRLAPGEVVYVPPGTIHSYVRGFGLEVMATSDNVVRAGLSGKHKGVRELLRITTFRAGPPRRLAPECASGGRWFRPPVADFALWTLSPAAPAGFVMTRCPATGPRLVVCCGGRATLTTATGEMALRPGRAAFVPDADGVLTVSTTGLVAVVQVGTIPGDTQDRDLGSSSTGGASPR